MKEILRLCYNLGYKSRCGYFFVLPFKLLSGWVGPFLVKMIYRQERAIHEKNAISARFHIIGGIGQMHIV